MLSDIRPQSYAACIRPHDPIRVQRSDAAEKETTISFGEVVGVLGTKDSWSLVETENGSIGWTDTARLFPVAKDYAEHVITTPQAIPFCQSLQVRALGDKTKHVQSIPFGGRLPMLNQHRFSIGDKAFEIVGQNNEIYVPEVDVARSKRKRLLIAAISIANGSTYEWGGTNTMAGFDCSGLVMTIFNKVFPSFLIKLMPRNSSEQALVGELVDNCDSAKVGDLAFFSRAGKVRHVGIISSNRSGQIEIAMAANGRVHTTELSSDGKYDGMKDLSFHSIRRTGIF